MNCPPASSMSSPVLVRKPANRWSRIRSPRFDFNRAATHFFLDDYRFETVWARPERALEHLRKYRILLTPDFSLYADWPQVMQQWNVYRSRWCGHYWQELGFQVIPSVSWSTPESFKFCFDGLPRHSLVAVSALGVKVDESAQRERFMAGFREMVERLAPSMVLTYGGLPDEAYDLAPITSYAMCWHRHIHAHRRVC